MFANNALIQNVVEAIASTDDLSIGDFMGELISKHHPTRSCELTITVRQDEREVILADGETMFEFLDGELTVALDYIVQVGIPATQK